jgi:hypothetical protein
LQAKIPSPSAPHPASSAKQLEFNQKLILAVSARLQQAGIRLAAQGTPQN